MAITDLNGVVASTKLVFPFSFASIASATAGVGMSLWKAAGNYPAAGATPSTAAVPTDADYGFSYTNPTSPALTYLHSVSVTATIPGMLVLYDRLSHMGGLSGTSTAAQTVNTAAITRGDTTGLNVEGFLEWYSATGSTATTATVSYTSDAGTSGQSGAVTLAATRPASCFLPIPYVGTSKGIRSVQSVTLAASTTTAGNFGVTLARRIASIPIATANIPIALDWSALGAPTISDDACLMFAFISSSTTTGVITGHFTLMQG